MLFRKLAPVLTLLACIAVLTSQAVESPAPEASPTPDATGSGVPAGEVGTSLESSPAAPSASPAAAVAEVIALDLKTLDFSGARVSLAGPASLYFRNVLKSGEPVSLLFKRDAGGVWNLAQVNTDTENFFPQSMIFDFARLDVAEDGNLVLDGVLLNGQSYKTKISLEGPGKFRMDQEFQSGELVGTSLERLRSAARPAYKGDLEELDQTRRMNQELLAKIGSLDGGKTAESPELLELKDQVAQLGTRNESLNSEMSTLKVELDRLKEENRVLAESSKKPAGDPALVGQPADKADIQVIDASIKALGTKVDKLSDSIQVTQAKVGGEASAVAGTGVVSTDVETLRAEIKKLSDANEALMAERNRIEQQIRETFLKDGYIATIRPQLTKKVLDGFANAKGRIGAWKFDDKSVRQTDPKQYFAQLDLPLLQEGKTMLYRFKAKSTGKDWVGLGLHIVASKADRKGYGHGESLLVWLTRDREYYRNNNTYLQLYRSDDDINMGRVLDAAIKESVSKELQVEVLYQPREEYITIAVDGVEKIRYKTWFGISQGVEVSLRTLDTAIFSGLEVWSE